MHDPAVRPALWMLGGAVAFALMGALTHAAGERCDWVLVAFIRTLFMFVAAVALARWAGVPLVVFRPPTLWLRSLSGSLSLCCNFFALTRLPVADAVTLSNLHPLGITLATAVLLRMPPTTAEGVGVVSSLLGVYIIERPQLDGDRLAILAAVMASLASTVAMFGLHRLRSIDSRAVVAHFAAVGAVVAGVWAAFRPEARWSVLLDPTAAALVLGVGLCGTIGQVCLTRAYAAGVPSRVSVIGLSQVVFAMGLDVTLWGRRLDPLTLLGFALVLAPTAWLTTRAGRKLRAVDHLVEDEPEPPVVVMVRDEPRPEPSVAHR